MAERSNGNAKMLVRFWLGAPFLLGVTMKKRIIYIILLFSLIFTITSCKSIDNSISSLENDGYKVTALSKSQLDTIQRNFLSSGVEVYVIEGYIISKKTSSTEETAQLIKLNSKSDARRIIDLYDKRFNSYTSMTYYQDDECVIYGSANIVKYFK